MVTASNMDGMVIGVIRKLVLEWDSVTAISFHRGLAVSWLNGVPGATGE